jgi:hypothetical protein
MEKVFTKLFGLQYRVEYKKGKENLAADALSRVSCADNISDVTCHGLSVVKPKWLEEV